MLSQILSKLFGKNRQVIFIFIIIAACIIDKVDYQQTLFTRSATRATSQLLYID